MPTSRQATTQNPLWLRSVPLPVSEVMVAPLRVVPCRRAQKGGFSPLTRERQALSVLQNASQSNCCGNERFNRCRCPKGPAVARHPACAQAAENGGIFWLEAFKTKAAWLSRGPRRGRGSAGPVQLRRCRRGRGCLGPAGGRPGKSRLRIRPGAARNGGWRFCGFRHPRWRYNFRDAGHSRK